ncbi:MAG: peptidoglycan-binding protein [Clostridia bacterium]
MRETNRLFRRFRHQFIKGLKRFLRACYHMGKPMCIFMASSVTVVIVGLILIITIPNVRQKKAKAALAQLEALATPIPTPEESPTPQDYVDPMETPVPEEEEWITKGAKGEDVLKMQKRLMELGYLEIDEPTSYYGNVTQYAVQLFQRQHELQQDGIAGEQTLALLYSGEAKQYVMKEGAEGDDIRSFQEQLEELGYLTIHQITGYYGSDTVNAVTKFQNRNHLSKDGKAGIKTLEAVNSADARVSYTKEQEVAKAKKAAAKAAKASTSTGRIDKMISIAAKQVGRPYILGKSGPDAYDCSGLVYYCLRQVNVYTRRLNAAGFSKTTSWAKVSSMGALKRGDLIFFKSDDSSTVGHVAIYIGSGMMIDASSANGKVMKRSCTGGWSKRNFVCGRRPIA